jgi:hypothetical protein
VRRRRGFEYAGVVGLAHSTGATILLHYLQTRGDGACA